MISVLGQPSEICQREKNLSIPKYFPLPHMMTVCKAIGCEQLYQMLCKVHHYTIILNAFLQVICYVMTKFYELSFAATFVPRTALKGIKNVIPFEMLTETAVNDMLYELTWNTGQRHRTIVGRICLISLLINWANTGMFPDVGKRLLMQRCLEKQNKDRR